MRITLSEDEFKKIIADMNDKDLIELMNERKAIYKRSLTDKKRDATVKASLAKTQVAKKKIEDAIKQLCEERTIKGNKVKVNPSTVSKQAGVAYNTALKYKDLILEKQKKC